MATKTMLKRTPGRRSRRGALATLAALSAASAAANDITGENTFICTAWQAMSCSTSGACETTEAWRLNLPDFVRVDLRGERFSTLPGSEEPRYTEIATQSRSEGRIFLHGSQEDRGYIWIINEASGEGTLSIVTDTTVISLFTVCAATDDID